MNTLSAESALEVKPSSTTGRKRWMFWLRVSAGILLVAYLMRHTKWKPVEAAIQGMAWSHWGAALAIYLASQLASGWRWAELARPLGFNYSRLRYMQLYFEGMFFNLCLPSSIGGDMLKAYWLAPNTAGRVLAGCTVLADRAVGLVGLCVIGTTALAARAFALSLTPTILLGAGLLVAALVAVSVGLRIWKWLAGFLPADGRLARLAEQLMPYHDRPQVLRRSVGWGMVVQGLNVLAVAEIGQAMGLGIPLGAYCVAVPAVALLTCLPLSIGGVGVREGGLAWLLASYGVSEAMGVTLGLLWFLTAITGGMVGGFVYFLNVKRPYEVVAADLAGDARRTPRQPPRIRIDERRSLVAAFNAARSDTDSCSCAKLERGRSPPASSWSRRPRDWRSALHTIGRRGPRSLCHSRRRSKPGLRLRSAKRKKSRPVASTTEHCPSLLRHTMPRLNREPRRSNHRPTAPTVSSRSTCSASKRCSWR